MKTKKDRDYSFNHTKDRILERYDIEITKDLYDNMCKEISNLSSAVTLIDVEKQDDDIQMIFDLKYQFTEPIRVVWSDKRSCITTAINRR